MLGSNDRRRWIASSLAIALSSGCRQRDKNRLSVAAASSLRGIVDPLDRSRLGGPPIDWTFGSSGKLASQICAGLPVELFLSANKFYADSVHRCETINASPPIMLADGRLAWFPNRPTQMPSRIVIANPKTAPFGVAAIEALESIGWQNAEIIATGSAAAVLQTIRAGGAAYGLTAASFHDSAERRQSSLVAAVHHRPITHYAVCVGPNHDSAMGLIDHLTDLRSANVWQAGGYDSLPPLRTGDDA